MAQITLTNVGVTLPVYNYRGRSFRASLTRRAVGASLVERTSGDDVLLVQALKDISVDLKPGTRLALIGRNGAGKTTLLRVLSGIYPPTEGNISIQGRVSSLTDIMMGMDHEATGYENIRLRAIMLGLSFKEASALVDEVAEFSELGEFLNLPTRTYSSGMQLRLAFAVTTAVHHEILIMDELIGTGDRAFMDKAERRIQELVDAASIFVIATHDDNILRRFCNTAILLEGGRALYYGDIETALARYSESVAHG